MGIKVDIQKKLGAFRLDISFASDAKRIGILGPSGCGKSMTLKSIAGIEQPDKGYIEISVPGMDLSCGAERHTSGTSGRVLYDSANKINLKPQQRNVGYMFQNYALFPTMSVVQNIAAGLKLPPKERDKRVREMVDRFHLQGLEKHLPGELSGGQQQRVALARIMAYRPDLILLDEPFSALDQHLKERLQHEMLAMLEDYQGQVIMVSHSRDEIYRFSEELLIMESGSMLARGETLQLFDDPGSVAVASMTGCKNFSAAQRLDSHTLHLTDWGVDLHLQREIPEGINAIGYRAHFFRPVWGAPQENCIPFRLSGFDELPFERRYYIIPNEDDAKAGQADALICWFVQDSERRELDRKPAPDWLQLQEEAVLLLREEADGAAHIAEAGRTGPGTPGAGPAPGQAQVPTPTLW